MKILLANSPFGGGGITTYAVQLIKCLSADSDLTVVLSDDKIAPIEDNKVKVLYYDTKLLTIRNARFFINLINNEIKPEVVIASAAPIIPIIAPFLNDNIKVITVSHSGKFYHSDYSALNNQFVDKIIAASSDYNKRYLERKFKIYDKQKIDVIYNFLDGNKDLEGLRFIKKTQTPIKIVYAGGASVHKSPELVAQIVYELLKTKLDFRFYWMGKPTIPLTTTIMRHSKLKSIKQLFPEDSRLVFPGFIPSKKDFDNLLGGANIMLAPSHNEGCSMALLEGHRAGSIFIVSDYGNSNSEIVRKGNSGFVLNHSDVNEFVEVIKGIIENPKDYEYLYENSHNTFITYLSYGVWKNKIFSAINNSLNHKRRHSHISNVALFFNIVRMKWLYYSSFVNIFFQLSLPSYITFRKLYRRTK